MLITDIPAMTATATIAAVAVSNHTWNGVPATPSPNAMMAKRP